MSENKLNFLVIGFFALLIVGLIALKIAFWGSLITSSIKGISNNCEKTYFIEKLPLISGNWFCN